MARMGGFLILSHLIFHWLLSYDRLKIDKIPKIGMLIMSDCFDFCQVGISMRGPRARRRSLKGYSLGFEDSLKKAGHGGGALLK